MVTRMYSVFDSKAAVYGTPFFMARDAMAVRAFSQLCNDAATMVGKFPSDFTLYCVGYFDDETATVSALTPEAIVTASALVAVSREGSSSVGVSRNGEEKSLMEVK